MNDRRKTWYRLMAAVGAVLLTASVAAAAENPASPGRLNTLFLLADDLGWADLGCYGAGLHETPHLDRLAKSAVRFTTAYAAAPVCTPTRAAILTGKHPARLRMTTWREATQNPPRNRKLIPPMARGDLPHEEVTLAKVLQAAGYLTAHVGKWHLGEASHFPETHGFDVHIGGNHWGAPATFFSLYRGMAAKELRYVPHLEWGRAGEYLTDRLTDEAIQIIERAKERPFFLNLWHYGVHTPIQAKAADVEHFTKKLKPGMKHQNATYAAMVKNLDDNVGRLLAKLDELKLADRTVIVFTSDNGGYLGNSKGETVTSNHPLRSGKGSLYEGGVRVPLLVRWPGVTPAGAVCAEPVTSTDFYRTLLDIAAIPDNVKRNTQSDGLSLVPLLKDPKARLDRDAHYWHFPHYYPTTTPASAVRAGDWKLLEYHEDSRVELYNLKDDLGEAADLAAKIPEKAAELRQRLQAWRKDVGAQMPAANSDAPQRTALFDGKTLDGWVVRAGKATYRIEDGAIVGTTIEGSPNTFLCTKKEYRDFELTFEVQCDAALNSGVQVRSHLYAKDTPQPSKPKRIRPAGDVYGPQVEISADGNAGRIWDEARHAKWHDPAPNEKARKAYQPGAWNRYRIVAQGERIRTWVNGVSVADIRLPEKEDAAGFLGLQVHSVKPGAGPYQVRWRNIQVRCVPISCRKNLHDQLSVRIRELRPDEKVD